MTDSHGPAPQAETPAETAAGVRAAPAPPPPPPLLAFAPVPVRPRCDGWTPQKQRDYVEMLADTGVSKQAAAHVGMSEQSVSRLRRRADARAFDLACEAAMRLAAPRIRSVAWERAVEGTVKQHFYHGELKGEERVYDNRLLLALLGKLDRILEPPEQAAAVAANWQAWMDAIEQARPAPLLAPPASDDRPLDDLPGSEPVWQDEKGIWWTEFPPPAGFDGRANGVWDGVRFYKRTLTPDERAAVEALKGRELEGESARRDRYFGFRA